MDIYQLLVTINTKNNNNNNKNDNENSSHAVNQEYIFCWSQSMYPLHFDVSQ